jgi:hypothetical protein
MEDEIGVACRVYGSKINAKFWQENPNAVDQF